ncbi:hypothetical protein SO802_013611 [Lithocarpus litseifolius]|uniref:Uncharacterized protein n=1 Tax=Lithocarpus litseifolius TaxID=425828 RepID=A0AAW2D9S5_9ROSI
MVPFFLSILIRKKDQPIVSQSDPSKFQKSVFKACFSVEFAAVALATCLGLGVTSSSIVVVGQVYESLSLKSNSVPYIVATACVATYCGRLFCWCVSDVVVRRFKLARENGSPSHKLTNSSATWDSKRDMLVKSGAFAIEQSSEAMPATASPSKLPDELPQNTLRLCAEQLSGSYDLECGGFGSALKFPRPVENQLMLYWSKKMEHTGKFQEVNEALKMVLFSLQCLARGGIHEHVGCGYHRYSVDKFRHVPHFEKMLYDQGQIASLYLSSSTITTNVFYSCVSWDIFDYLRREVIGQEGEIFSAEDADSAEYEGASRKKEGAFYVWTSKEVDDILGQHAMIFKNHFYIKPMANCDLSRMIDPHHEFKGKNVLFGRHNPAEMASKLGMPVEQYLDILGECRKKAFEVRSSQPRPHLDDKVIVSWNGLSISSFSRASIILKGENEGTKFNFPVVGCDSLPPPLATGNSQTVVDATVSEAQNISMSFANHHGSPPMANLEGPLCTFVLKICF